MEERRKGFPPPPLRLCSYGYGWKHRLQEVIVETEQEEHIRRNCQSKGIQMKFRRIRLGDQKLTDPSNLVTNGIIKMKMMNGLMNAIIMTMK